MSAERRVLEIALRAARRADVVREERDSRLRGAGRDGQPHEVLETMAEDGNALERRVWAVDHIERLFRFDKIDEEAYRIARCLEADWLALTSCRTPARFHRIKPGADDFCVLPAAIGAGAPGPRRDIASDNLRRAHQAAACAVRWGVLTDLVLEGRGLREIEVRRTLRRGRGVAATIIAEGLSAIGAARVYETTKWRVPVRATMRLKSAAPTLDDRRE